MDGLDVSCLRRGGEREGRFYEDIVSRSGLTLWVLKKTDRDEALVAIA
jgi:hypothetical protein